jgi:hypothetical protein
MAQAQGTAPSLTTHHMAHGLEIGEDVASQGDQEDQIQRQSELRGPVSIPDIVTRCDVCLFIGQPLHARGIQPVDREEPSWKGDLAGRMSGGQPGHGGGR